MPGDATIARSFSPCLMRTLKLPTETVDDERRSTALRMVTQRCVRGTNSESDTMRPASDRPLTTTLEKRVAATLRSVTRGRTLTFTEELLARSMPAAPFRNARYDVPIPGATIAEKAPSVPVVTVIVREAEPTGVTTNLPFLRWLVAHPDVRAGRTTTAFLTEHPPLSQPPARAPDRPFRGAWRLNGPPPPPRPAPDVEEAAHEVGTAEGEQSTLTAPMPGTVIKLLAAPGDRVQARQPLLVLEAMKMETPLVSPYEAVVRAVHVAEGDSVEGGAILVELEE